MNKYTLKIYRTTNSLTINSQLFYNTAEEMCADSQELLILAALVTQSLSLCTTSSVANNTYMIIDSVRKGTVSLTYKEETLLSVDLKDNFKYQNFSVIENEFKISSLILRAIKHSTENSSTNYEYLISIK